MERIPSVLVVNTFGEDVHPGWIYDNATMRYQPRRTLHPATVETSQPSFTFEIWRQDKIRSLVDQNSFQSCQWVQEYRKWNTDGTIILHGSKTVEMRGVDVKPSSEHHVVRSVNHQYFVDMLIHFNKQIDYKTEIYLKKILSEMVSEVSYTLIPSFDKNFITNAFIYPDRQKSMETNNVTHGLAEFVRMLLDSKVSCHPSTTIVFKPLRQAPSSSPSLENEGAHGGTVPEDSSAVWQQHGPHRAAIEERCSVDDDAFSSCEARECSLDSETVEDTEVSCQSLRTAKTTPMAITSISGDWSNSADKIQLDNRRKKDSNLPETQNFPPVQNKIFNINNEFSRSLTKANDDAVTTTQHKATEEDQQHPSLKADSDSKSSDPTATLITPIEENTVCGMTRKYYGVRSTLEEKTIILLGASGSGKTTLVNFIANYFRGTKKANGHLVKVALSSNDAQSVTKSITAYTFCAHQGDIPITVIDTPGLNDSSGAEVRDHVCSLKTFLANFCSQKLEIHAIGFVAQAHLVRLTSSERLVMDYISTLFGEGSKDHIITFVTFSDNQEHPPVEAAMESYGVKCKAFLKFNNSALSNSQMDETDQLDLAYWRIGCKSWKKCIHKLQELPALSVKTMKALQKDVYTKQVVESTEKDLKYELNVFVTYTKSSDHMNPEAIKACESVWELVTALTRLKWSQSSSKQFVDTTLVEYTEDFCRINNANGKRNVQLLSLAPSRMLMRTGIGIVQSMEPVYKMACASSSELHNTAQKSSPTDSIYCHVCQCMRQVEKCIKSKPSRIPFMGSSSTTTIFQCNVCKTHLSDDDKLYAPRASTPPRPTAITHHKLLQHTKKCVSETVCELSIPHYLVNEKDYLRFLNHVTNYKYTNFIEAVMNVRF